VRLTPIGKHAIVIGAGIGGLAAAAAVGGHFERVTVVERDVLPLDASPRPGAPQDNHFTGCSWADCVRSASFSRALLTSLPELELCRFGQILIFAKSSRASTPSSRSAIWAR
jgi:hypothetical protein